MPTYSLGPIEFRAYAQGNWSNVELAYVSARKGGLAERENAVRIGVRSDSLTEAFGEENTEDTTVWNGTTFTGRETTGFDGTKHVITSKQRAARAARAKAMKDGLNNARQAGVDITGDVAA